MNNQIRRELLNRHRQSGFPGSIMDVFSAYNAGRDIISEFIQEQQRQQQLQQMQQMQQQQSQPIVANTPEEQEQGLRPYHEAGQTDQSMVFPNIPANTPFNTVGMKAPINIDKYDNQGHLIESFKSVPPGIQNLPTGPQEGTVVETPANMQTGGVRRYQTGSSPDPDLAPGITQLPEAVIQTDRVPYSKISDNSRMMGVGWAKPFFEAAGNNPDSKLYKIGQKILDERKQDLDRSEMIMEFTSIPGFIRTAERLEGKDPLKTIAKEGKIDLLSTLPLAGGIYKGLRLAEKGSKQAVKAAKYATTQTPLRNAYKYNPWAFKPDPDAYYHRSPNLENIINQEKRTLQGFGQSKAGQEYSELAKPGRGNTLLSDGRVSTINLRKPANSSLYFSKGVPLDYGRYNPKTFDEVGKRIMTGQGYPGPYMVEVKGVPMGASTKGRLPGADPKGLETYAVSRRPISLDEAKFYKEDWLRGYRQINPPKQLPGSNTFNKYGGVRKYQTAGPRRNTNAEITTLQPMDVRPDPLVRDRPAQRVIDPRAQRQTEEQAFQTLMFNKTNEWRDPNKRAAMTSGRAESVSPATYVTPAGDLQGIIESGAQIAEGNYLEGGLGAGLAAASVLLPGTIRVPNSAQDLFEAANVFKKHNITKADEAGDLVSRAAYNNTGMSEELANAAGTINIAENNARQLYRDIYPSSQLGSTGQNNTGRLINTVLGDYPQLAVTYNTGMMNSPEVASAVQDFGRQYLTSFRGVHAKNLDEAAEFLTSPFGTGDRAYGPGIYSTSNLDRARYYGNVVGELRALDITPDMSGKSVMGQIDALIQGGGMPYAPGINSLYSQEKFDQIVNSLIGNPQFGDDWSKVYQNLLRTFGRPIDNRRGIYDTDTIRVFTGETSNRIVPKITQLANADEFSPTITPIWQHDWSGAGSTSKYFFQKQGFKKYGGLLRSGSVRKYQGGGSKNVDPFSSFEVAKQNNMAKKEMIKRADGSYSQRGLWDNIRANKGSGKKPTAAMLKQEKKIKAKSPKK